MISMGIQLELSGPGSLCFVVTRSLEIHLLFIVLVFEMLLLERKPGNYANTAF